MTTMTENFTRLPDDARLWVFGAGRALSPSEEETLLAAVDAFLTEWKAHGHPLSAAREWRDGRFLMVAVDERVEPPSGCSIDALVRILQEVEKALDVEILGSAPIWYRDPEADDAIRRVSRPEFRELAGAGKIDAGTIVFDPSITRLGELRAGRWERPAGRSWHRRYLA